MAREFFRKQIGLRRASAAFLLLTIAAQSHAQTMESVMSRSRPAYDAIGVPLGGFNLLPSLNAGYSYDDNVYLTDSDHRSDSIFTINPKVALLSQWSQDALDLFGGVNRYEYASQGTNNRTDWNADALGRLDIGPGITLASNALFSQQHEARNSPNDPNFIQAPVQYLQDHGDVTFTNRRYRLGYDIGGTVDRYNFHNTPLIGGGVLDNQDRNETTYSGFVTGYYEFIDGYAAFLRATHTIGDFDQKSDRTGVNRSSTGNEFDSGIKFLVTSLISGEAFLGYLSHDYHNPLPNVSGLDFGGKLLWNITPLMTVHAAAARILADTTLAGTSAEDNKQFMLGLDYELLRNLIILSEADYTVSTFPGSPLKNKSPAVNVAAKVLINSYFSATVHVTPTWRDSNQPGQSFNDLMVGLTITAQL